MGRREQREQIFKLLFRVEFNELEEMPQQRDLFLDEIKLPVEEDGLAAREKDLAVSLISRKNTAGSRKNFPR